MGFLSFFWSSPLGIVAGFLTAAGVVIVVVVVAGAALAFTGGPGPCTAGGDAPITVNAANAQAFDDKWMAMNDTLDAGSPASANFTESEVSSYVDREAGSPFSDVRICIHDGFGEATAKMDFLAFSANIKVTGNVAFAEHPEAVDVEVKEVGNLSGFVAGLIEGLVEAAIDDETEKVDLEHSYTSIPTEGNGRINGTP